MVIYPNERTPIFFLYLPKWSFMSQKIPEMFFLSFTRIVIYSNTRSSTQKFLILCSSQFYNILILYEKRRKYSSTLPLSLNVSYCCICDWLRSWKSTQSSLKQHELFSPNSTAQPFPLYRTALSVFQSWPSRDLGDVSQRPLGTDCALLCLCSFHNVLLLMAVS